MGGPLSDRRYFDSLPVKQDCKASKLASTESDWPSPWWFSFLPLCQVASSFNNLTRLHCRYVLLPELVLVLCSVLQKPGAKSPLISKRSIGPPCRSR